MAIIYSVTYSGTHNCLLQAYISLGFEPHDSGSIVTVDEPQLSTKADNMEFWSWGCDIINVFTVSEVVLA